MLLRLDGHRPASAFGYDVALTEVLEDGRRQYLAEAGTERGSELLASLPGREATEEDAEAGEPIERTAASMGRQLDTEGLPDLLAASREHPRWDEVAERCLTCGNCTMVCPTCFCTTVEDVTDLTGSEAERRQVWDSCFGLDFTYLHGGGLRPLHRLVPSRHRHQRGGGGDHGGASMSIRTVDQLIGAAQLFSGLAPQHLETIAGCASTARFDEDAYVFPEGGPADTFYVVRSGAIALETHVPGRRPARVMTLHENDGLGWSWLFPPYRWQFDAQASSPCGRWRSTERACARSARMTKRSGTSSCAASRRSS